MGELILGVHFSVFFLLFLVAGKRLSACIIISAVVVYRIGIHIASEL